MKKSDNKTNQNQTNPASKPKSWWKHDSAQQKVQNTWLLHDARDLQVWKAVRKDPWVH